MKRPSDHVTSIGFTGLLTSLVVWAIQAAFPDPAVRPFAIIGGGLLGAVLSSELLFRWVTWSLRRDRSLLDKMMTAYESRLDVSERRLLALIETWSQAHPSKKVLADAQSELDRSRQDYIKLFSVIRDRLSRITDQLSS